MKTRTHQSDLFDIGEGPDQTRAAFERAWMRKMIDQLTVATDPPWIGEMDPILALGSFKRAMGGISPDEAAALWAEYDVHFQRLYALWVAADPAPNA